MTNVSGIIGPLIAGSLSNINIIGRKYTMVIGALLTMAFFFGYTAVTTPVQNVAFSCVLGMFWLTPKNVCDMTRFPFPELT